MRITITCAVAALVLATTHAQSGLEPGFGAYARMYNPGPAPSVPSGIVVYHPYLGQNTLVTGLPAALSVASGTLNGGPNAVLVRDGNGTLLVAALYRNIPADIFEITLNGTAATVTGTYSIGTAVTFSAIDQMAWLNNDEVLFSHRGVANSVLQTQGLGILNLTTRAVRSVNINNFPAGRSINCVAVDPTGPTAYFGTFGGGGGVYSVPLAGGSATALPGLATLASAAQQLAVDHNGLLYIATGSLGLLEFDPATAANRQVCNLLSINGLCIDPISGHFMLARINAGTGTSSMNWWNQAQGLNAVNVPGMSGLESPTGVAVRASLIPFGSKAPNTTDWQIRPNPGGAPRIGNLGFSLTTTPPATLGWMAFTWGRLSSPTNQWPLGNLLLNRNTFLAAVTLTPTSATVNVPLRACLSPGDLYAQVFTIVPGAPLLQGGEGLRIHVYQ